MRVSDATACDDIETVVIRREYAPHTAVILLEAVGDRLDEIGVDVDALMNVSRVTPAEYRERFAAAHATPRRWFGSTGADHLGANQRADALDAPRRPAAAMRRTTGAIRRNRRPE